MLNHMAQEGHCILNSFLCNFAAMELNERIHRAITASRLPQKEIASYCGVSPGAVSQWKKGDVKNLKFENLYRLADITGFSARWLAIGEGPERSAELPGVQLTSHEAALLSIYRDLSQDQQEMLFGIIRGMKSVEPASSRPKSKDRKDTRQAG
ncbi:hypothetical protein AWH63_06680 [Marinobacter sp. C18]|uniref:helix-turn-helix domain-containing protein n=1 Tax=Marinobacter sp. C18 TaxID=1772288 RepID=UPI000948C6F0|nr:helix-turn-helix domain-containing protein [Marinobacter sp. C18]OLF82684.1 hypothetical protein AWH63_06680 [Marinobacter sp. C18]